MKKKFAIIALQVLLVACLLSISLIYIRKDTITNVQSNSSANNASILVNNEKIFFHQIKEFDNLSIINKYDQLNKLINDVIILQEAKKMGLTVDDKTIEMTIKNLQENQKDLYDIIMKKVSIDEYKLILRNNKTIQMVKEKVTNQTRDLLYKDTTDDEIKKWIMQKGGKSYSQNDFNKYKEQLLRKMIEEKCDLHFNNWVIEKRKQAGIDWNNTNISINNKIMISADIFAYTSRKSYKDALSDENISIYIPKYIPSKVNLSYVFCGSLYKSSNPGIITSYAIVDQNGLIESEVEIFACDKGNYNAQKLDISNLYNNDFSFETENHKSCSFILNDLYISITSYNFPKDEIINVIKSISDGFFASDIN